MHGRRNPFVNQVSFFVKEGIMIGASTIGRNPFVNQVSFFQATEPGHPSMIWHGRNPFVNQVSFFKLAMIYRATEHGRRNPFVNQVSFFGDESTFQAGINSVLSRNPFVNQVSFFYRPQDRYQIRGYIVAIPS